MTRRDRFIERKHDRMIEKQWGRDNGRLKRDKMINIGKHREIRRLDEIDNG